VSFIRLSSRHNPSLLIVDVGNLKRGGPTATIPDIQWSDDLIWQSISQIEWHEYQVVLLGKRQKGDVSGIILTLRQVNKRYEKAIILMHDRYLL
jgi:hypothetical protein